MKTRASIAATLDPRRVLAILILVFAMAAGDWLCAGCVGERIRQQQRRRGHQASRRRIQQRLEHA